MRLTLVESMSSSHDDAFGNSGMNIAESSGRKTSGSQFRSSGGTSFSASSARPTAETPPHSGFAICTIIAAQQMQKGQQLRPDKLTLAETASVALERRFENLQADLSKGQEHDFVHRAIALIANYRFRWLFA